jgi:hypothetical protein
MLNTTRVRKTNQAWQQKYCIISEVIRNNIEFHVAQFSKTKKAILNYLLDTHYIFKGVLYFRQDTIAAAIGCERETVNRLLLELEQENFIVSNYRHKTSCLYKISRTLYDPFIQSRLGHIFSILRDRSELLAPTTIHKNVTQCINKKYIDIKRDIKKMVFDIESMCGVIRKQENGISMILRDMKFTLQEKIRLSAFPDCVLQYAKEKLKTDAISPIAYFFKLCFNFCEGYDITPNWGWSNKLKDLRELKTENAAKDIVTETKREPWRKEMNQFHPFEEEDHYTYPKTQNPGEKFPQKGKQQFPEPRRRPGGISPANPEDLIPKKERLWSREELEATVNRLSSCGELGRIGARAIMERQTELLSQLSPNEQAAWAEGALLK